MATEHIWNDLIDINPNWRHIRNDSVWGPIHDTLIRIQHHREPAHERIRIIGDRYEIQLRCNNCDKFHPIMTGFGVRLKDLMTKGWPLRKHRGSDVRSQVPLTCDGKKAENDRDNALYAQIYSIRNRIESSRTSDEKREELKDQGRKWDRVRKTHRPHHRVAYDAFYDAVHAPAPIAVAPPLPVALAPVDDEVVSFFSHPSRSDSRSDSDYEPESDIESESDSDLSSLWNEAYNRQSVDAFC